GCAAGALITRCTNGAPPPFEPRQDREPPCSRAAPERGGPSAAVRERLLNGLQQLAAAVLRSRRTRARRRGGFARQSSGFQKGEPRFFHRARGDLVGFGEDERK